jgi:hypothetical protein
MRLPLLLLAAALAYAQGTKPKPAPAEYDVHVSDGPVDIGAEYMVHSFSNGEQMFIAEQFLVVEVAFYPLMKTDQVTVDYKKFGLRLNGKTLLPPVPPAQVADALRQSPWFRQPQSGLNGSVGAGPIDVPIGGGGGNPNGYPPPRRAPAPPRAPEPEPPGGIERTQVTAEQVLRETALPPGPHKGPVSGFVYFYYKGKPSSLKAVELDYDGLILKLK